MGQARAEIDIAAPIERIWKVMLDTPLYSAWNPFIRKIDCPPSGPVLGADLLLHVEFLDGAKVRTLERITRLDPPPVGGHRRQALLEYQFRGPLAALNLVRGFRQQQLQELENGGVRYTTSEQLTGMLAWAAPLAKVQDGFERHAAALKRRCEIAAAPAAR